LGKSRKLGKSGKSAKLRKSRKLGKSAKLRKSRKLGKSVKLALGKLAKGPSIRKDQLIVFGVVYNIVELQIR